MSNNNSDYYFLSGGGEMGALIRSRDWSKTSFGEPADWPQSLRITLGILLNSKFPMFLWWGDELTCFYNDAYRPSLGNNGKHPSILGLPAKEAWPEIWDIIKPLIDKVVNERESVWFEDRLIPIYRNGKIEDVYWTFSYSPVPGETGEVAGVLVTCSETTEKVLAIKKLEESGQHFRNTMKQAPVGITILRGPQYIVEMANDAYLQLVDRNGSDFVGGPLFASLPEVEEAVHSLLDNVLNTGIPYHGNEVPIPLKRSGKQEVYYFDFLYHPLREEDGKISGVIVAVTEVTKNVETRKSLEESKRLYEAITQSTPDLIYVFDLNYRFAYANQALLKMWGRTWDDSIGKSLLEVGYEPWHAEMHEREIDQVIDTKSPVRGEVSFPHATLGMRVYDYILVPVIDGHGNVEAIAGTTRDITQQVEAHKQIEESKEKLNVIIEASELGTWELNLKTNEPSYSKRYLEIIGGYKDEIKLTHAQLLQHLHPDDFPIREKAFREAFETGYLHYESRLVWPDRTIHWMEGKGKVFYDEENVPLKLIGTIRDTTEEKNNEQELRKSEEQFSTLADNMENLAWLADGEGWIYWYNKRWMEYTGLSLEEMQGWGWQKVHHPDHVERIVALSKKIWHTNETFELIFPLRRHDGEYRWFLTRGYPVTNEEGKIVRWIGTNTDINEQKKAEEQFKILADQAPLWVWLTDKEVNVIYTNPEVLKFLGLAHYSEMTGTIWEKNVHPEEISMVYQSFGEAVSLQKSFSFECRVLNASTQLYEWFYIKAVPRLEAGEITGFIGTGININEQKTLAKELEEKVETRTAELKASEEKFYTLFNLSPICKTLSDAETGRIVMVNDAFINIFGYSREEALNKTTAELGILDPASGEGLINELNAHQKIHNIELEFIKGSGEKFFALSSVEIISIGGKRFYLATYNDISDRKQAEKGIEQKNIELEKMNKELQSFAYISSHDLQEPLRKIQTFATRIKVKEQNNLTDTGIDMFNRMQDAAKRMQTLIQDLLAYSRTNTTEQKIELTDLNEIIAEVKEDLSEELMEKHATIETHHLGNVNIIPFQFRQLMHNLIGNSLKFSDPNRPPLIKISSEIAKGIKLHNEDLLPQNKYCHITVSDNGIGFEQQYNEKIFDVFQRLHSKNEYNGTGIGLSIVKKIVENHHGSITAKGELNKGATFDIYIPAT